MDFEFVQLRDDGTVDARLGPEWPLFSEALADAVSSLPPRGSEERHLSTYWIDQTLRRIEDCVASGGDCTVASGNAYSIRIERQRAVAVFDYGDEDTVESTEVDALKNLLVRWREAVLDIQKYESREVPETYRRNPWP